MYLRSLELHGFKSFPDKVTLEFGKGLTAVVGPNGSGKSNIGDAVRWVLGEQSTKTLRGGKMEDVIFGGTQQRKAVGFASVTLNISNEDRTLSVDSDLVSVTRKLYRNGDSEYLLNGSQVRLKDIVELFMDTGLGRDGYSIIGQGRVADIVGSKSNERREIFEEAAGISKFRYKKAESERRLASAEENILRLKDILSELEGRVEPLRIQSEKAKKFLVLADSRRSLEISVWTKKLGEITGALDELEDKLLAASAEYEHLGNEIERFDSEIAELAQKRNQCTAAAEDYRTQKTELENESSGAAADIAVIKNNISHFEENIRENEQRKAELSLGEQELQKKIADIAAQKQSVLEAKKALSEEISALESQLKDLNSRESEFEKSLSESNERLNSLYIRKSELTFTAQSSETQKTELLKSVADHKEAVEQGRAEVSAAESELEKLTKELEEIKSESLEHQNRLNGFSMLYRKKSEQLKELKEKSDEAELKIRNLTQRKQMLEELEISMEGFAGSVRQIVKAGRSGQLRGVRGTVASLISTDKKYSLAIETALGGALQNIVVDNEEVAKRGIRILKETNGGRATFLPLTSVKGNTLTEKSLDMQEGYVALASELVSFDPEYQGVVNSLLGRIAVAEDIDLATVIAKKYGYRFRIITLDGQVINAGGSFTGGSSQRTTGVLSRKNEITSITSELEKLTASRDGDRKRLSTLTAETDKLGYDVEGERDMISRLTAETARLESEQKRVDQLIRQYKLRISEIENLAEESLRKISDCEKQKADSEAEAETVANEISELERKQSAAEERSGETKKIRETYSEELSQKRLKEVELTKDAESADAEIERVRSSIENSAAEAKRYDERIAELRAKISEEETRASERAKDAESSKQRAEALSERIKAELSKSMEYDRLSQTAISRQRAKSEEKEGVSAEISRITERRDNLKRDSDGMITAFGRATRFPPPRPRNRPRRSRICRTPRTA